MVSDLAETAGKRGPVAMLVIGCSPAMGVVDQTPDAMTEKYPASMFFSSFAVNIFDLLPAVFVIVSITLSGRNSNLILCHKLHKSLPAELCGKALYIETYRRALL